MKIKITGINGYLGQIISKQLIQNNHEVLDIKRETLYGPTNVLKNDLKDCDILINLAGAPILKRWTKKDKQLIYNSRIETTRNLVRAINRLDKNQQPKKFISASAIGIYKSGLIHDETSTNFDTGFVGNVVKDWEETLKELPVSIQKNIFRIGLVLGKEAKTIKNLILPFKLGFGATLANGKQAFPFVHEKDVVRAFVWAIENHSENGTFNLVAPENISNKEFTKAFSKRINRPALISIPSFILKIILGEAASLLIESPVVNPLKLQEAGFTFHYPTINSALSEILA